MYDNILSRILQVENLWYKSIKIYQELSDTSHMATREIYATCLSTHTLVGELEDGDQVRINVFVRRSVLYFYFRSVLNLLFERTIVGQALLVVENDWLKNGRSQIQFSHNISQTQRISKYIRYVYICNMCKI